MYVQPKYRGTKKNKFAWATEQNEAREIYVNHYHGVDNMDHMIKTATNIFISWKYWHAPYLHAMTIGVIAAYDMYLECSEGLLDTEWKVAKKDIMSFSQLRLRLSEQMLNMIRVMMCILGTINSGGVHRCIKQEGSQVRISVGTQDGGNLNKVPLPRVPVLQSTVPKSGGNTRTCYLQVSRIPTWSDQARSHLGAMKSTLLPLAQRWLI